MRYIFYRKGHEGNENQAFELDMSERTLKLSGMDLQKPLKGQDLDVFAELVKHSKHLVTYSQLITRVWNDKYGINESNVTSSVARIRRSLGESRSYIETIPGEGYRFTLDCRMDSDDEVSGTLHAGKGSPIESGRSLPETLAPDFSALGTIHVHVDGVDADDFVGDLVNEFNIRKIPCPSKINSISEDEPGPQRLKKPETYGHHTPGGIEEKKKLEYFSTHLFGSFAATKRELKQLLSRLHEANLQDKDIVVEAERIIGKIGNGDNEWVWSNTFLRNYPSICSGDVGYEKLESDSIELHFAVNISKEGRWEKVAPLTCRQLREITDKLEIDVGGWFRFEKKKEPKWAFRSNQFEIDVNRNMIEEFRQKLAAKLTEEAQTKQFKWELKAVVEQAIGIWQIPLKPYNELVSVAELSDWEAKYPSLRDFWVVTPNFLGDKEEDIENAMIRNLGSRSGVTYTYFLRSIADYKRLQSFTQGLSQKPMVDDVYGKIKAVMVLEDISRKDDLDEIFKEGGCFISNPLSAFESDTVDDADGYVLIKSEERPGRIAGARVMEQDELSRVVRLLKPLTEHHPLQGVTMTLRQQKREPIRGAIVYIDVEELPHFMNEIEDKAKAKLLNEYDLAVATLASQLGGQVVRSIERGYLIIFQDLNAAIPCAEEIQAFAKQCRLHQKIAVDFGDVWKVMRAHGIDYCGRRVNRCRKLLERTKPGEVTMTPSFVDALPISEPANIVESKRHFIFNKKEIPIWILG